ncbi:hypothetical protein HYH03_002125 [Edaphochlamys debaryana]|uniref:Uncharacterized protein n=1 Tax=Edaphochlamys debaryana TaxID=47281 RepID=A0A835YLF1_9CHLO|nr:hypothetical protein HYH03_002125 [Edaphochlamys debaryana]|eukprot:KAG2499834.1 hypothetical protein HYH03_002125 [Edaphochlamys debaryana]
MRAHTSTTATRSCLSTRNRSCCLAPRPLPPHCWTTASTAPALSTTAPQQSPADEAHAGPPALPPGGWHHLPPSHSAGAGALGAPLDHGLEPQAAAAAAAEARHASASSLAGPAPSGVEDLVPDSASAAPSPMISAEAQAHAQGHHLVGLRSSLDDLGVLGPGSGSFSPSSTLSSTDEADPEMCVLETDAAGEVQMVCESDPGHPISLAQEALQHPVIPTSLLQDLESKLEADISTLCVTILFAVGFITMEWGINDLMDNLFGDDNVLSSFSCIVTGLQVVFGVKFSRARVMRLWPAPAQLERDRERLLRQREREWEAKREARREARAVAARAVAEAAEAEEWERARERERERVRAEAARAARLAAPQ